MWLLHMEQTDGVNIMHGLSGREYKLPDLPRFSADGYYLETLHSTSSPVFIFTATRASRSVMRAP